MPLKLYMNVQVPRADSDGFRRRGVEIVTVGGTCGGSGGSV